MTPEELQRSFNTKLARWGDRTSDDIVGLVGRTMLHLPPGTAEVPELMRVQLRVLVGFAIREAALAGMQLQARKNSRAADRAVLRDDKPLAGVTAISRGVVSDLRPRDQIPQRMAQVVAPELPPAAKAEPQSWDDVTTQLMRKPPDLGDE